MQRIELLDWNQEWTVSTYLIRISEFRINSDDHESRGGKI